MRFFASYILPALLVWCLVTACDNNEDKLPYKNKAYINSSGNTATLYIKPSILSDSKTIEVALAQPVDNQVELHYKVDYSLVGRYGRLYDETAQPLPEEYYDIPELKDIVPASSARSLGMTIDFIDINELDREEIYVLPVTLVSAGGIGILDSGRTMYFVVRGASLINVVADMERNSCSVNWSNRPVVEDLAQVTMEALARARYFTRSGSDSEIVTVMGVEGHFLMRCGDSNAPGQIQIAFSGSNFPARDTEKVLPLNEWVHLAVTYDSDEKQVRVYVNGRLQSEGTMDKGPISFTRTDSNGNPFGIGKSWNSNRWWPGELAECRIWNVIRTQEEIASSFYEVDPLSEGLVAYWKFDEGAGNIVKDHTGNGNDAVGDGDIMWTPVSLPERSN